jgi:hypothetical protein
MRATCQATLALVIVAGWLPAVEAQNGLIYQSATPVVTSTTGVTSANGFETDPNGFSGVNFQITTPTLVHAIGGHFYGGPTTGNGEIFGALVPVASLTSPPASPTLDSGVIATTLLTLPPQGTTDTIFGPVNITLDPGFYAVLFGSGKFGATSTFAFVVFSVTSPGFTGPVNTNGVVTYSLRQSDGMQIFDAAGSRFFVSAVPEPSSFLLVLCAVAVGVVILRARRPAKLWP